MSMNERLTPVFLVYVDGARLDTEHEGSLVSITVTDRLNGVSECTLVFNAGEEDILDKGVIQQGSALSVRTGYKDNIEEEVFQGDVTDLCAQFPDDGDAYLEVRGSNALFRLTHVQRFRTFEEKKPSEIVEEILGEYGLAADVDEFGAERDFKSEEGQTDLDCILEFAKTYGKQVWADGETVYVNSEVQAHTDEIIFERGKSLIGFEAWQRSGALLSEVDCIGWDHLKNEAVVGKAGPGDVPVKIGGGTDWADACHGGDRVLELATPAVQDSGEAQALAIGRLQINSFLFMGAKGCAEGNYKLRAGMRVTVKYVGEDFEGEWMADTVTHTLDEDGYITEFTLKRNMYR